MGGWREVDSGLCLKLFRSEVCCILMPLQSLALEILLHRAAHFAVTKMYYFYSVAKPHTEFEEYFQLAQFAQLICRSFHL